MTTSDLIKLLQQEDSSGKLHVRINGMMPDYVEKKPGYLDGPYEYMDDGKLVFSTEGEKVDIHTLDIEDWAWENYEDWESKIRFDYLDDERENEIRAKLDSVAKEAREYDKQAIREFSSFVMRKIKDGYKVVQNDTQVGRYNTMYFTKSGSKIKLRQGDCRAIIRGSFKPIIKKDYIEWEPKSED